MRLNKISVAELALRIMNQVDRSRWYALVVSPDTEKAVTDQLNSELRVALDQPISNVNWFASVREFLRAFHSARSNPIVASKLAAFTEEDWRIVDYDRSNLLTKFPVVFLLTEEACRRMIRTAPNLASLFGSSVWECTNSSPRLTEGERAARLAALRSHFQLTDEEVLHKAERGELPRDPDFGEWLILLERDDLIGN